MFTLDRVKSGVLAALLLASPALALNTRSFVSHNGSDLNNCSMPTPCLTWQHGHDQTVAGGEVDALDAGDFGSLSIDHAITIDGANLAYMINTSGFEVAIVIHTTPSAIVIIRNLSMNSIPGSNPENAILWQQGSPLFIEHVAIEGYQTGIDAVGSPYDNAVTRELFVTDATIRNCTNAGIWWALGDVPGGVTVARTAIENSAIGIDFGGGKHNVSHTVISAAQQWGIYGYTGEIQIEDSSVVNSGVGLFSGVNCIFRIAANNIHDNTTALVTQGGQILSFGNNRIAGNGGGESPSGTLLLK
jgi:hypothetical protein